MDFKTGVTQNIQQLYYRRGITRCYRFSRASHLHAFRIISNVNQLYRAEQNRILHAITLHNAQFIESCIHGCLKSLCRSRIRISRHKKKKSLFCFLYRYKDFFFNMCVYVFFNNISHMKYMSDTIRKTGILFHMALPDQTR